LAGKYSHDIGSIRFYPDDANPDDFDEFDGVVSVKWLDDKTVKFYLAHSAQGYKRLQEAISLCEPLGAIQFQAARKSSKRMPPPWRVIETHEKYKVWMLDKSANVAALSSATKPEVNMKAFNNENSSKAVTEVTDAAGNVLWRVTREYGAALPAEEALAMEKILLSAAEEAKKLLA
jgi:hypothetical protein